MQGDRRTRVVSLVVVAVGAMVALVVARRLWARRVARHRSLTARALTTARTGTHHAERALGEKVLVPAATAVQEVHERLPSPFGP